jgi:tetratricopeptide (TPR) repeat protein
MFAEALNNLANVYSDWNKHNEAIPLYTRAVEVQRALLGPKHKNVAVSLRNLGINHQQLNHNAEALAAYQEAYEIFKEVLGKSHPDVKTLNQVILYLRGDPVQEALTNAVHKIKNIKIPLPKLRRKKAKTPQKLKLLSNEPMPPAPDDDSADEADT